MGYIFVAKKASMIWHVKSNKASMIWYLKDHAVCCFATRRLYSFHLVSISVRLVLAISYILVSKRLP